MNKLDEIALRVAEQIEQRGRTYSPDHYVDVVKLVLAELSKDEPVAICDTNNRIRWNGNDDSHRYSSAPNNIEVGTKLFTHPANTAEIEQRVVEAITHWIRCGNHHGVITSDDVSAGKWREYL